MLHPGENFNEEQDAYMFLKCLPTDVLAAREKNNNNTIEKLVHILTGLNEHHQ